MSIYTIKEVDKMNKTKLANRLINEKSPYLLQHAYNPVNWYQWSEDAFAKARAEDSFFSFYQSLYGFQIILPFSSITVSYPNKRPTINNFI
jgi:hypothetical protein